MAAVVQYGSAALPVKCFSSHQHWPDGVLCCLPRRPGGEWPAHGSSQSCAILWTATGRSLPYQSRSTCLQEISLVSWPTAGRTSATVTWPHCHIAVLLSGGDGCSPPSMSHACLPAGDHLVLLAYSRRDISHPDSQPHHVEAGKLPPCKAHRGREKVSPACCLQGTVSS